MEEFANQLFLQMEDGLTEIGQQAVSFLRQLPQFIYKCQQALSELRNYLLQNPFEQNIQEIYFFKEVYPRFYSLYIYYTSLFHIEVHRPTCSDKMLLEYLDSHLNRLRLFFESNADFYQYHRSGSTHLDEVYYIRGQQAKALLPDDLSLIIDPSGCTLQSYKLARLLANEQLRIWLNNSIAELGKLNGHQQSNGEHSMQWTGSKISLIELIYALHGSGVFNNATADIKQLTSFFEKIFHVKLGNVYNSFNEMRIRKKNRSTFLDLLKERLIQRMDEADEK